MGYPVVGCNELLHANWINWIPRSVLTTSIGQAIILSCSKGIVKDNGAFALMISGGFVSGGPKTAQGRRMLKLWTIIRTEEVCNA